MFVARINMILNRSKTDKKKEKLMTKFFIEQIHPKTDAYVPPVQSVSELETNREAIRNMVPLLKRIYIDEATRDLFPVVMKEGATIIMTPDFIEFLEKVSSETVK